MQKKRFISNLEALRGLVGILVVLHHVFSQPYLDPDYDISNSAFFGPLLRFLTSIGHLCVLIFFILSGYVIGISSKSLNKKEEIIIYLKKRIIRIYPIYFISIILAVLISEETYEASTVIHNLSFTQTLFSPIIKANNPTWSLQYEVIYYLLFIPISYFRINPILVTVISILIGVLNYFALPIFNTPALTSYSFGFAFWSSGLILAKYFKNTQERFDFTRLVSLMLLIISLSYYNVLYTILRFLTQYSLDHQIVYNNVYWSKSINTFLDISFLPYGLFIILIFADTNFKYKNSIYKLLQLLPTLEIIRVYRLDDVPFSSNIIPTACYLTSTSLLFLNKNIINTFSKNIINISNWLGSLSYGIYILHFPILFIFLKVNFFSGSIYTFTIRLILYIASTIIISYLLEKKLQPAIKSFFNNKNLSATKS